MHDIEPHFHWRDRYTAETDDRSPFFGREYDEFQFSQKVYNYFIHPQWDDFGSPTLYAKLLFVDYEEAYAIVELIGEWNDAVTNDIMLLKQGLAEPLMEYHIDKFILIAENVLNFHGDEDDYYQEWREEVADYGGWIALINTLPQVEQEMQHTYLDRYILFGDHFNDLNWRPLPPMVFFLTVAERVASAEKWLE